MGSARIGAGRDFPSFHSAEVHPSAPLCMYGVLE